MYLNCKTYFSYHYGTYSTEELVKQALSQQVRALALTNINGTPDVWEFVKLCREGNIKPLVGCEIRNDHRFSYILLAKNEVGLTVINRFLSLHKRDKTLFPDRPSLSDDVYIIYELNKFDPAALRANELIGVKPAEINKLYRVPVALYPDKFVVRQPVTFQNTRYFSLHRLLRAIDLNTLYTKLNPEDLAGKDETFKLESEIISTFEEHPTILARTNLLIEECGIETTLKTDKNKKCYTGSLQDDRDLLKKLALEGITKRYKNTTQEIEDRINKELKVIDKLNFNAYYLMVWDVIKFAQASNFFYVGRGSGANSIVAYLLEITNVDPIKLDLYFERFLNEFRTSPPDFDIDFSHKDRDAVISYIFDRYGEDHIALLGMYSTFKRRAIIRELGKVMGLPKAEIDRLVRNQQVRLPEDSWQRKIEQFGSLLLKFPNHHSIHAGGMLISEKPIYTYSAQEMPPKGFATSQMDMILVETIGLFKLDILSQRGLGHIKDTISLVKKNKGITIDINRVDDFMQDEKVAAQIRKADTIGCFYIESPAMRQLLLKLKCDDYLTLVAASSIIRPGVSQSGMMKTYIHNYHHPDQVKYLHPKMEDLLQETYGVMVYQEDVIKVAHHFGGLDMAESDILRRAMSGKYRGTKEMDRLQQKFFVNCEERGYPAQISLEVWRQIASFAGYSFSKAHSASFAIESYQSLYLKTYYPMEFMVGVINNFGGFYRTEFYFHELKRAGAKVHAPCVNNSELFTSIIGDEVYVGLIHIEKLNDSLKERILFERNHHGLFLSLKDFIERVQPGLELLNILIRINALRFTGINKKDLLWRANFMQKRAKDQTVVAVLFQEEEVEFQLPELYSNPLEEAIDEIEILGFSLGDLFSLADTNHAGITLATELPAHVGKEVTVTGRLVTTKDSWTKRNEHMMFGTFLDAQGNWLDTVHWPNSLVKFPFLGNGFYKMTGKVMEDFGVYAVEVRAMVKIGYKV
ncbi:DNA polymerase III alpha subunit [Arcticibacter svalbardensis MN12-7]|uniref:DNA-directed DNA polymerase n=1 Tax=Arcticibacter svalbardensis MN12-7 TaxID=1150600 RepID=R9GMX8_9SPHI|nr:DNA polymerase III subunit alpha [Arcticibacter svalbardensis]EOR92900.1 DNA polymerase III alpha subunit [Arcticibacter svalbardensis MN12-7]